jgi:hypothetical protein
MLLTANTRGACSAPLPPWFSSRRAKQLAGLYPGFHRENRLEPGICGTLARSARVRQSVTQTPEDRRAADSAVEVLGAAATLAPAGFTVRTLKFKLLVTSTVRRHPAGPGGPGPRALTAAGPRLTEVGRDPGPGSGSVTPPALEPWGRDRAASYITDMVMLV